jgi:beta-N-acetylhexosaminidase
MIQDATVFPDLMALAAGNNKEFAYELGKACALEGRANGVHWTFGPVVDISVNPNNPITNTRSLGDNPDIISSLASELVKGMQDYGLIATLKHFPGDGFDDRDQHICTTINPLNQDEWLHFSGKTFQDAIDVGAWSIMVGHIALPSFEKQQITDIMIPAVASKSLVSDLLKDQMGFKNLVITDAIEMGGVVGYKPIEEAVIDMINAGCDMLLFSHPERDFTILKTAVENGQISKERIDQAARMVLALKEVIGLHKEVNLIEVDPPTLSSIQQLSQKIAQNAITLVKDTNNQIPLCIEGQSVFCYHIRGQPEYNVENFDNLLKKAGFEITSANEQDEIKIEKLKKYDTILILAPVGPTWGTGRIRPNGTYLRNLWFMINSLKNKMIAISFGSPYILHDIPWINTYINAYSPDDSTQQAVLDVLLGNIKTVGKSPVDLTRSNKINFSIPKIIDI